jgi:hypothetical protein
VIQEHKVTQVILEHKVQLELVQQEHRVQLEHKEQLGLVQLEHKVRQVPMEQMEPMAVQGVQV